MSDAERIGTLMSVILPRLARLSDQRDQEYVRFLINEWDSKVLNLKEITNERETSVAVPE